MNDSTSTNNLLLKGYQYIEQGKCSQALEVFEYLDKTSVDNEKIKYALGLAYLVQEQHQIISFNPPDSKQLERAIEYFNQAIQLRSHNLQALAKRGTVLALLGKNDQALKDFDTVIKSNFINNVDWRSGGDIYFAASQVKQAFECYEKALVINSNDHESMLYKALCLEGLQQFDLASATYQTTLQILPNKILALINYGRLLTNLGNNPKALEILNYALSIKPNSCSVLLWRGIVLEELNRFNEALESIDLALSRSKNNFFLWYYKGKILGTMQKNDDSLICLDRALSINPDFTLASEEKQKLLANNKNIVNTKSKKKNKLEFYKEYLFFLMSIFDIFEKGGGKKQVYLLLKNNLDKLDFNFGKALNFWASEIFKPRTPQEQTSMASIVIDLSNYILEFPLGNISDNVEIAIIGYQTIISLCPKNEFTRKWVSAQNNLSMAFWQRKVGDTRDNIEFSIQACESALEIATEGKYPLDWSLIQQNLAIAYLYRIEGVKKENLEFAKNLAENALKIRTEYKYPLQWADNQNNLGLIYSNRIKGNRKENIKQAIISFKNALRIREEHKLPIKLAETFNNIANAYLFGSKDTKQENIKLAISYFKKAHEIYTESNFPYMWAGVNTNLGIAYNRLTSNQLENVKLAITALESALKVRKREIYKFDWAETQMNLGLVYLNHPDVNQQPEILELAITAFSSAIEVYTKDDVPLRWAMIQNNLGIAYSKRIINDVNDNIQKAIDFYSEALTIYTPQDNPKEYLETARNLGRLAFDREDWKLSIQAYSGAIQAIETSRSWSTDDLSRQEIISDSMNVYAEIIQACINDGELIEGLQFAERSRCRHLVDLMAGKDLYNDTNIPSQLADYLEQYKSLERLIYEERERERISNNNKHNIKEISVLGIEDNLSRAKFRPQENSQIARWESDKEKVWQKIRTFDRVLAEQIRVPPVAFDEICQLIPDSKTAIVYCHNGLNRLYVFIIYKNRSIKLHLTKFNHQEFLTFAALSWAAPYLDYFKKWQRQIPENLIQLADNLDLPKLVETYLEGIEELIIIPHLYLHFLPFAALPINPSSQEFSDNHPQELLGDRFRIRTLPSAQILQFCNLRAAKGVSNENYGLVEDADNTLPCSQFEGEHIAQIFNVPENNRLRGIQATVNNYKQLIDRIHVLHSSHHASSRFDKPLESHLVLADGTISLGSIMSPEWRLPELQDVFLSCCETNLNKANITDDPLTIATGFLCAGARSVVSTLWAVDDLATAIFSTIYYQLRKEGLDRPTALQQAQFRLRSMSGKELYSKYNSTLGKYLRTQHRLTRQKKQEINSQLSELNATTEAKTKNENLFKALKNKEKLFKTQIDRLSKLKERPFPFSHPYYWAPFISQGLR
ncbi:MAG: CHAT domain-containing protein [Cyanobacteria bacterium J06600_6]